jgi:hypothetical protein
MAFPTNTLATYEAVGNREDLADVIYKIATTMRPFQENIKKGTCKATFTEWQKSTLRTPVNTNKAVQGDDTTATAAITTTRIGNRTQIFKECASVTNTQQAVDSAGRPNEMSFQVLYKGENLLNDMEMSLLANLAAITGDDTTAPQLAGALAWMSSNVSRGSGGSSGSYSGGQGAATNGTQRTFTEALLKTVLASAFTNGASGPKLALMSATHKQVFSSFTGIADIRKDVGSGQATIVGAADVYIGDFGQITTVPVQFGLTRDVLIIDPAYWELAYLRSLQTSDLAITGDSKRKQLVAEATLKALNEKSSASINDLS